MKSLYFYFIFLIPSHTYSSAYIYSHDRFWSIASGTLTGIHINTNREIKINIYSKYTLMSEDGDGVLWLGGSGGVAIVQNDTLTEIGFEKGLLCKNITCFYLDAHKVLWIGTSNGLFCSHSLKNDNIKKVASLGQKGIKAIFGTNNTIYAQNIDRKIIKVYDYEDNTLFITGIFFIIFIILTVLIVWGWKKIKIQNSKKISLLIIEQQMLLQQMNPHFIFNALNAIRQHILSSHERDISALLLQKYSTLMRLYLESSRRKKITINNEITCLDIYLSLEKFRLNNKFEYHIELQPALFGEIEIAPFFIQPIVENAIWHGILPKGKEGKIDIKFVISQKNVTISITDDGVGRHTSGNTKHKTTSGHALKIIQERIKLENQILDKQDIILFNIEDMSDNLGNVTGTRVQLVFPIDKIHTKNTYS
ncbi:MAG: histidine kinase [Cytophagales bacterium]|nr:histidine kinase [Cytophagales bacterium]